MESYVLNMDGLSIIKLGRIKLVNPYCKRVCLHTDGTYVGIVDLSGGGNIYFCGGYRVEYPADGMCHLYIKTTP